MWITRMGNHGGVPIILILAVLSVLLWKRMEIYATLTSIYFSIHECYAMLWPGNILCMRSIITVSLIGWVHTQNDPWMTPKHSKLCTWFPWFCNLQIIFGHKSIIALPKWYGIQTFAFVLSHLMHFDIISRVFTYFPLKISEKKCSCSSCNLTHCGLMMRYGNIDLGQHWLRQWLVTWQHQAITWTKLTCHQRCFCGVHLRTAHTIMKCLWNWSKHINGDYTFKIITTSPRVQWVILQQIYSNNRPNTFCIICCMH